MTLTYTNSAGEPVEIATMAYPHLVNAHAKATRDYQDRMETARSEGVPYSDPDRLAESDAMKAEIAKRDAAYAAEQADAIDAGEGFRPR